MEFNHVLKRKRQCCYLKRTLGGKDVPCKNTPEYTLHTRPTLRIKGGIYEGQTHHLYSCREHVQRLMDTKEFSHVEKYS